MRAGRLLSCGFVWERMPRLLAHQGRGGRERVSLQVEKDNDGQEPVKAGQKMGLGFYICSALPLS